MGGRTLILGACLALWGAAALAQDLYRWKDASGQWHFSQNPPAGVAAERVKMPERPAESPPVSTGDTSPGREAAGESPRPAAVPEVPRTSHWFLILPDEKIVEVFDSDDACQEFKAIILSRSKPKAENGSESGLQDMMIASRCVPSEALEPSTPEPDVIVISQRLIPDPVRVAHYLLRGRVVNRGRLPASEVELHYEITRTGGMEAGHGKVAVSPNILPKGGVGEYRALIVGIPAIEAQNVRTHVQWSGH
ncbi:MAG TPA: DUF4124 domain-containing protein [Candidatus Binatia bacterium]